MAKRDKEERLAKREAKRDKEDREERVRLAKRVAKRDKEEERARVIRQKIEEGKEITV